MQDLGAAGLTSASVESVAKSGGGLEIDILKLPRRAKDMTPYEVMLSESQERMLVIVKKGCENEVKSVFDHYDLRSDIIGRVTSDGIARINEGLKVVAEAPIEFLANPPLYRLEGEKPEWLTHLQSFDFTGLPDILPEDVSAVLLKLLASPNIASKEWVYRQYDHEVQINTIVRPGSDASVLRIKGTQKGIALTTDGNGRYCFLDPKTGGSIAVAEAARNLACAGAEAIALTNCLNFGNPEKPEIYWQLEECIRGMSTACEMLKIPVVSGNVSLYNETKDEAIYPTPVIGMLGLIENIENHCTSSFKNAGDEVFLLAESNNSLAGSEYLARIHGKVAGMPSIDLEFEKNLHSCIIESIKKTLIESAHDCSDGGLAVALAESCITGNIGFEGNWQIEGRLDEALFGEGQSRVIVSINPANTREFQKLTHRHNIPMKKLGFTGGNCFVVKMSSETKSTLMDLPLQELADEWHFSLGRAMSQIW
jgi:phosphoribosylformylglycinamidine synthase